VTAVPSQPLVIFLHVPKTAGSTLRRIIERQHDASMILPLYESDFGEELAAIPPQELDRLRIVMGHFYFGAHAYLSRASTYITLLRDPIERVISHYHYAQGAPSHYFHRSACTLSLKEFVKHCATMSSASGTSLGYCSDNDQTRQLAGECGVPSFGTSADEMLTLAKRHLTEHFAVVGTTEEFDRSLILMSQRLGWRRPFYTRQNVTHYRTVKNELPSETLHAIQAYNELDLELYRYAERLLQERIRNQGASFEKQLRSFEKMNAAYGAVQPLVSSCRQAVGRIRRVAGLLSRRA
jgi:hypothetical protein